jgi:hypothetical protein
MKLLRMKRNSEPFSAGCRHPLDQLKPEDIELDGPYGDNVIDLDDEAASRCFLIHPYHFHEPLGTGYVHGCRWRRS